MSKSNNKIYQFFKTNNGLIGIRKNKLPKVFKSTTANAQNINADYIQFDPSSEKIQKILKVLYNCFPNTESSSFECLMYYFSTVLFKENKNRKIAFMQGNGMNGKSLIVELMTSLFPDSVLKYDRNLLKQRFPSNNHDSGIAIVYSDTFDNSETLDIDQLLLETPDKYHVMFMSNTQLPIKLKHDYYRTNLLSFNMKIKFVKNLEHCDNDNNLLREADDSVTTLKNDKEFLNAFLSILCFYYLDLNLHYGGLLWNVLHKSPYVLDNIYSLRLTNSTIDVATAPEIPPVYYNPVTFDEYLSKLADRYNTYKEMGSITDN